MNKETVKQLMIVAAQVEESKGIQFLLEEYFNAATTLFRANTIIEGFFDAIGKKDTGLFQYQMHSIAFMYFWGQYDNI